MRLHDSLYDSKTQPHSGCIRVSFSFIENFFD